jgi:quinoprotein dehydrogenase-associated probable ABC transporter substrate-binding protein
MSRSSFAAPYWRTLVLSGLFALLCIVAQFVPAAAQTADLVDRSALRVCADPANMPFSNQAGEGFENKIAELFAGKLGVPVLYTWFPQATGFIRNTLGAHRCDVVIGFVQGHELVQNTNHYYESAYVLLYPEGSDLEGITTLGDPRLVNKRIGVVAGTPPATIVTLAGLMGAAKPYPLVVDRRFSSPAEDMIADIAKGEIDAGILWGPIGGYYAKASPIPLRLVPLIHETVGPRMVYRITMGIRRNEPDWKHQLNELIAENQDEINRILSDYGVPLLDAQGNPLEP